MLTENERTIIAATFGIPAPKAGWLISEKVNQTGIKNRYNKEYTAWSILPILKGEFEHLPTEIAILENVKQEISKYQAEKLKQIITVAEVAEPTIRPMKRKKTKKHQATLEVGCQ